VARKLEAEINPLSKGLDTAFHTQGLAELMVIYKYLLTNQLILGDMFKNGRGGTGLSLQQLRCEGEGISSWRWATQGVAVSRQQEKKGKASRVISWLGRSEVTEATVQRERCQNLTVRS